MSRDVMAITFVAIGIREGESSKQRGPRSAKKAKRDICPIQH
jgi:hypothetical protein